MAVSVNSLKSYLRLPPDTAADVEMYLAAARSRARSAGIPEFANNAQYDMFVLALAAMYYDNRGMTFANPADEQASARLINSFVLELRYAENE
jgi:hypothetical protein